MNAAAPAETCPINHDQMKWLWEHNKPIMDELREVVEPLTEAASDHFEANTADRETLSAEMLRGQVFRDVPLGEAYTLLPPRLFGTLAPGMANEPTIPRSSWGARQLANAYEWRRQNPPDEGAYQVQPAYNWAYRSGDLSDHLYESLRSMRRRGIEIDPVKWERYKEVGREMIAAGRYDLDVIHIRRAENIAHMYSDRNAAKLADDHATGVFESYMMLCTDAYDADGKSQGLIPVGYIFMPVGEYGPEFAEKLLRTTAYAINDMQRSLVSLAPTLVEGHEDLLRKHTARGDDGRPLDASLITMTQEGARSIMEATAVLMANKVEGFDDPDELFQAIVEQGILEEFTRVLPMGSLGSLAIEGKYFPHALVHEGNGKLGLNPEVAAALKQAKMERAKMELGAWAAYWALSDAERADVDPPASTSLICPAAMPHSAIRRMSGAMLKAFQAFNFRPREPRVAPVVSAVAAGDWDAAS